MKHGPDVARWVEWGTRRPVWFIKERLWGWVGREKHWEGRQTGNYLIRGNPKDGTGSWHIIWLGINTSDNKEKEKHDSSVLTDASRLPLALEQSFWLKCSVFIRTNFLKIDEAPGRM